MNDQEEYIEAYFNNKLDAAEKLQFENRCVNNEAFAGEVALYLTAREGIRQKLLEDKKQEWAKFDKAEGGKKTTSFKLLTMRRWLPYAAAACVLFFVALYYVKFSSTPHQLAATYFSEHLTQLSQTMSVSPDSLQKGIAAYNYKDYTTALQLFEDIHRSHPEESDPIKYIGNVYLATKNYDSALGYFDELAKLKSKYSNPGMFLKAVTLLIRNERDDKAQAKLLLEEVVNKNEEGSKTAIGWLKKW